MNGDDLYGVLGVAADASRAEIVHAYRRHAHAAHPDVHPDDPGATRRFRELTDAYDVLRDPQRRAVYDQQRAQAAVGSSSSAPATPTRADRGEAGLFVRSPLWAGPVHVDPPPGSPATDAVVQPSGSEPAELFELLTTWLGHWRPQ